MKDRHKRPNIDDILHHPYVYSYYIVYGGQLAQAKRKRMLAESEALLE